MRYMHLIYIESNDVLHLVKDHFKQISDLFMSNFSYRLFSASVAVYLVFRKHANRGS